MNRLFILFQYISPHHLLSRFTGLLAEMESPVWLKDWLIAQFVRAFDVDMSEAEEEDMTAYPNFNAFFTRALKLGARPVAEADLVCPADGVISQMGTIQNNLLLQAKGKHFSVQELLGDDDERAALYAHGEFATIYLSPRDYHRVHMPVAGRLVATTYIPGKLFSVNAVTADNVDRLFARNERLVCHFETERGPMAMILVGAMIVAGIETIWAGRVAPPPRVPSTVDYQSTPPAVNLDKGAEMGRFCLGSTVILLFPKGVVSWHPPYSGGSATLVGAGLADFL